MALPKFNTLNEYTFFKIKLKTFITNSIHTILLIAKILTLYFILRFKSVVQLWLSIFVNY